MRDELDEDRRPTSASAKTDRNESKSTSVPNYFKAGGGLDAAAQSYVERPADRELLSALQRREFCYVLDSRQVGKSSMMVRTAAALRASGCRVAIIDLTSIGSQVTLEQWYYGIVSELGRQLKLEDRLREFWRSNLDLGPMNRLMEALRTQMIHGGRGDRETGRRGDAVLRPQVDQCQSEAPLVIFIDEVDALLALPFRADEFLAGIRECYTRRANDPSLYNITFCIVGSAMPEQLIRDSRTTPFNIGTRIVLTDFTEREAAPLAAGLVGGPSNRSERDAKSLLAGVLGWTGGHPYLTQRLCAAAVTADARSVREIDRVCDGLFFAKSAFLNESNLTFVRDRVLLSGVDIPALLTMYSHILRGNSRVRDDPANTLCSVLRLSGLVRSVNGVLKVRNRIYSTAFNRAWIAENMPELELRRQRAAYRRGLVRAGVAASLIVGMVTTVAGIAIRQTAAAKANEVKFEAESVRAKQAEDRADASARQAESNFKRAKRNEDKAQLAATRADDSTKRAIAASNEERKQTATARAAEVKANTVLALLLKSDLAQAQMLIDHEQGSEARAVLRRYLGGALSFARNSAEFKRMELLVSQAPETINTELTNITDIHYLLQNGHLVIAGDEVFPQGHGAIEVIDLRSKEKITNIGPHGRFINHIYLSSDERLVCTVSQTNGASEQYTVKVWDINAGTLIQEVKQPWDTAAFPRFGRELILGGTSDKLTAHVPGVHSQEAVVSNVFNSGRTGQRPLEARTSLILALSRSNVLVAGWPRQVQIIDFSDKSVRPIPQITDSLYCGAIAGTVCPYYIVVGMGGMVYRVDPQTLGVTTLTYVREQVNRIAVSPSGRYLAYSIGIPSTGGRIEVVDLETQKAIFHRMTVGRPQGICFINEENLAGDQGDGTIKVYHSVTTKLGPTNGREFRVATIQDGRLPVLFSDFEKTGSDTWQERREWNSTWVTNYTVSGRNRDYIELYDRQRHFYVRLYETMLKYRIEGSNEFATWPGSDQGAWVR